MGSGSLRREGAARVEVAGWLRALAFPLIRMHHTPAVGILLWIGGDREEVVRMVAFFI